MPDGARVFGAVAGVTVGAVFATRAALSAAGVHRPLQAGISGAAADGADSIVVSGGYEDDEDYGDVIIYTGHGGRDQNGAVIGDQRFDRGNRALARSCDDGLPVRVVRGAGGDPRFSPAAGYRYDGLFTVERYWSEVGRSGFRVWRYRIVNEENRGDRDSRILVTAPDGVPAPARSSLVTQRIVRSSAVTRWVKDAHSHHCQICGMCIETPSGSYSEGAHIRPLGRPHDGADVASNVLCLCPNDHVRFDTGAIVISDGLEIIDAVHDRTLGLLRCIEGHDVDEAMLRYHREMFDRDAYGHRYS